MSRVRNLLLASALAVCTFAVTGHANTISGSLWRVPEATSQNAIPANVPMTMPNVTFDVNSPFNFSATNATIAAWLASSSAFNVDEKISGSLASLMDDNTTGVLVQFIGTVSVTTGQTFNVTHDDGLTLIIGGLNLGFNPGRNQPDTNLATYTGPPGNFPFQLVYGECCTGQAVPQVDLPFEAVPSPIVGAGLPGLILAAGGLLALARRRRQLVV
jgi:hypothetical protein